METEMPHTHFCKRKKEKKESRLALWRVSKKQVLRVKYYPYGIRDAKGLVNKLKMYGWRFYPEPKA
jgi:hypothetical protein